MLYLLIHPPCSCGCWSRYFCCCFSTTVQIRESSLTPLTRPPVVESYKKTREENTITRRIKEAGQNIALKKFLITFLFLFCYPRITYDFVLRHSIHTISRYTPVSSCSAQKSPFPLMSQIWEKSSCSSSPLLLLLYLLISPSYGSPYTPFQTKLPHSRYLVRFSPSVFIPHSIHVFIISTSSVFLKQSRTCSGYSSLIHPAALN